MKSQKKKIKPEQIFVFSDGNMAVCVDGQQVPELQRKGWLGAWLAHAESLGYNPDGWVFNMPEGVAVKAIKQKSKNNRWGWEIIS